MQTGNQIESQSESFAAMPVAFAQDAENLQSANNEFASNLLNNNKNKRYNPYNSLII
jgi:hypothetical protein